MAVTTRFPTANEVETTGWTNPNNAHADDGVYATAGPAKNGAIGTRWKTFGFDGVIPAGATITKVQIIYEYKVSTTASIATMRVRARINDVDEENQDNTSEPLADTVITVDITANRSWVRADLLDAALKITGEARRGNSNTAVTFSLDQIKVEVTYVEDRRGLVTWSELETGLPPRRGIYPWVELETGFSPRRGLYSWAEFETPTPAPPDRRGLFSWVELETGLPSRRGLYSWVELETGLPPRRGFVTWAEFETPAALRRALFTWAEFETSLPARRGLSSWAELETGVPSRRGVYPWAEFETPSVGGPAEYVRRMMEHLVIVVLRRRRR